MVIFATYLSKLFYLTMQDYFHKFIYKTYINRFTNSSVIEETKNPSEKSDSTAKQKQTIQKEI